MSGLEAELDLALRNARLRWPSWPVADEVFRQALLQRLGPEATVEGVRGVQAADLYLVCACAAGHPAATEALEEHYLVQLRPSILRIDPAPDFVAEVLQLLRQKLLVAQGDATPRIGGYNGRSPLINWLRAAAVRTALNHHRDRRRQDAHLRSLDDADGIAGGDPELAYIRAEHRQALKDALAAAVGVVSQRQRTLLRLHVVEGLSIDRLATIYGAHRATVARWIAAARQALLAEVARLLSQRQGVPEGELASFLRAVGSRLDLSLSRLLREETPPGEAP